MDWQAMALLGAYHGINPGMGWLFAVALAMQQGSGRGVWRALSAIALGHAASIGAVVAGGMLAGVVLPLAVLRILVAVTLATLGLYRLWRHRHPRLGGLQVGFRDLIVWSFLMASAHGAGVMVLPFVMPAAPAPSAGGHNHAAHMASVDAAAAVAGGIAVAVHSLVYLAVMALVAWIVHRRLGLRLLRTAWLNLDWMWAGALVGTGVVVLVT